MLKKLKSKLFPERKPEPRFVNPYMMSEPTTPKVPLPPRPTIKDGKIVFPNPHNAQKPLGSHLHTQPPKPNGGFIKSVKEVMVSDLEKVSGSKSKPTVDKEAYDKFIRLIEKKTGCTDPKEISAVIDTLLKELN